MKALTRVKHFKESVSSLRGVILMRDAIHIQVIGNIMLFEYGPDGQFV